VPRRLGERGDVIETMQRAVATTVGSWRATSTDLARLDDHRSRCGKDEVNELDEQIALSSMESMDAPECRL